MAEPNPEHIARLILRFFEQEGRRPGEGIGSGQMAIWANDFEMRNSDLSAALEFAANAGWIKNSPNGFVLLTAAGFDEM